MWREKKYENNYTNCVNFQVVENADIFKCVQLDKLLLLLRGKIRP